MSLSREQALKRAHNVGASEVPALLGLSPYQGPAQVWDRLMGTGEWGPGVTREPNLRMRVGTYLEPHVLVMARWLGLVSWRCHRGYVHPTLPLSASPDAYTAPFRGWPKAIAEVKVTGAWTSGIDRATEYVRAQVQTQLMLTGRPVGWVVALQGSSLAIYEEPADPEWAERIETVVAEFDRDHLRTGVRPYDRLAEEFLGFTQKEK